MSDLELMLKHTQIASEVWREGAYNELAKWIHLRPTYEGITIVSTYPLAPMRGIGITTKEALVEKLEDIKKNLERLHQKDEDKARDAFNMLSFKERGKQNLLEEDFQARVIFKLINSDNIDLCKILNEKEIHFVGAEFAIDNIERSSRHKRVDVIAKGEKNLYLFQLKKGETTDVGEMIQNVKYYETNKEALLEILKDYPNYPVTEFDQIKGVMVLQKAHNSAPNWKQIEKENNIDIIFFRQCMQFEK